MSYETLSEFKANTGLKFDDGILQDALDGAVKVMQQYIFIPRVYQSGATNTRHILTMQNLPTTSASTLRGLTAPRVIFLADMNADQIVDKNDINAYEIDQNYTEIPRNANITAFNPKYGVITFDIALPTDSSKTLVIEYREAKDFEENTLLLMKELNELLAVNWVFQKIPFSKLQCGIPDWSINGVSVKFDNAVMNDVMNSNRLRIKELYNLLIPLYTAFNTLQQEKITVRDFSRNIGFQRSI